MFDCITHLVGHLCMLCAKRDAERQPVDIIQYKSEGRSGPNGCV